MGEASKGARHRPVQDPENNDEGKEPPGPAESPRPDYPVQGRPFERQAGDGEKVPGTKGTRTQEIVRKKEKINGRFPPNSIPNVTF